jgi:hypothetical protein
LTKDNVKDIVEAGRTMNFLEFKEHVRSLKEQAATTTETSSGSMTTPGKITSRTFKFYPDQLENVDDAIERAKAEGNTKHSSTAFEYICLDYLGKVSPKPKVVKASLKDVMKGAGHEKVLEMFEQLWPDIDLAIIEDE